MLFNLLPFLLLLPCLTQATAKGGGEGWQCPSLAPSRSLSCSCDLPHTLRCDGDLPLGGKNNVLAKLVEQVAGLPDNRRVALLDLSVRNLVTLPGRLLSKVGVEGLVVSSGQLANVSDKAFVGLEGQLTALGLPGNQLTRVPVQALSPLKQLSRLDLSGNQLPSLLALPSLPALEFLALQGNQITVLAAGVFQAVPHLRTLQLAANQLSAGAIYQYNLQHLSYLASLDLSSNLLSGSLSPPSFDLFPPNLRTLDLSLNSISRLASNTFAPLSRLTRLSLEGNAVEKVEDKAFSGLLSLTSLDLSHNSIVTLATDSLAGLPSLTHLNLAHNHLQVVSESLAQSSPLLSSLLLMDNDIATVAEGALDVVKDLKQLDLTGNPLDCDCHLSYLHAWLTSKPNSSSAISTALCATPPALANAPLASLPSPPSCSEEQLESQMDMPRADYYEYYYSEPGSDTGSPTFLSSAELQLASSSYHPATGKLSLVWQLEEAALPYTCGQLHVFQESIELGPVLVLQNALDCSSESQPSPALLPVTVDLAGHNLSLTEAYIFCISLLQDASVIPGCSGALHLEGQQTEVRTLEQQASLHHLHANVSADGTEVTIGLDTKVPPAMKNSCRLQLSLSTPTSPPIQLASTSLNCSTSLHAFTHLPPHTYYNVCAALLVEAGSSPRAQCLLAAAPRLRTAPRSVMPLLLTLVFLALGIACLTVLYLIVRRHREDSHHRVFLANSTVSPLMGLCWKLRRRKGPPAFFLDNGEDELP